MEKNKQTNKKNLFFLLLHLSSRFFPLGRLPCQSLLVALSTVVLLTLTGYSLDVVLFESISAFATVGLSTGITPDLPALANYVLAALMFAGRTGTMTLAAALALRDRPRAIRQPAESPLIG